jgi:hypothetical protein
MRPKKFAFFSSFSLISFGSMLLPDGFLIVVDKKNFAKHTRYGVIALNCTQQVDVHPKKRI